MDYWRLCDELSVIQAALLIVGRDPGNDAPYVEGWEHEHRPTGYEAAKSAIKNAIISGRLKAKVRRTVWERGWNEEPAAGELHGNVAAMIFEKGAANMHEISQKGNSIAQRGVIYRPEPDWSISTVNVDDLKDWLSSKGFKSGFFFPDAPDAPDYLDKTHPRHAPKLAAAVRAWMAIDDPNGRSPKQALLKWLREHAAEFGLTDDEGNPNEQGIEECARRWRTGSRAAALQRPLASNLPTPETRANTRFLGKQST